MGADRQHLLTQVVAIVETAGRSLILPAYQRSVQRFKKADGSLVTATDLAVQRQIQHQLHELDASIAFLGEEMNEAAQLACLRDSGGCYWCLDPLDGTTNFAANFPGFATSLALIEDGVSVLACIHDPVRGETFTALRGAGARCNGEPITASTQQSLAKSVGFIDFKRLSTAHAERFVHNRLYRSQRNIGSCALEWAWLAAGRAQFVLHGGEKVWDFAAGSLLASEAGCQVGDFSGAPFFPVQTLASPVLAACSTPIHAALQEHLR